VTRTNFIQSSNYKETPCHDRLLLVLQYPNYKIQTQDVDFALLLHLCLFYNILLKINHCNQHRLDNQSEPFSLMPDGAY